MPARVLTTAQSVELFIAQIRTTAEKTLAVANDSLSSAHEALVSDPGVVKRLGDRVPPIYSSAVTTANSAEQENQVTVATQCQKAEPSLRESTSARQAHFSSQFLRETNVGNNINHEQRSRARAQQRSMRRKKELAFELAV